MMRVARVARARPTTPFQAVLDVLTQAGASQLCSDVPKKWEKFGHVLVFASKLLPSAQLRSEVAEAFLEVFKDVDILLTDDGGIEGELRKPTSRVLFSRPGGRLSD
eukprot:RCo040100